MIVLLLCAATLLAATLFAANALTPRIHVADGETVDLGPDAPCLFLEGDWARDQQGPNVTYSLSFTCPEDTDLALYLSSSSSRLYVNGAEEQDGGRSFIVVPLASCQEPDGTVELSYVTTPTLRLDAPPSNIYLGGLAAVMTFSYQRYLLTSVVLGVTALAICYSLGLYLVKRTETYVLILAGFCVWCFLVSFGKVSTDLIGSSAPNFSSIPPVFGDPYTDGYLNHIYRKTGTAVVCCYLFGVFMPIRIRGVNVIWYLLACSLAPLPFVGAETYRFFSYVYLPLVVSLLEGYLVIRGASHTDRVTGVVFVVGSGLATGYRVFMGVSDFELCPHGIADMFYKNYSLVHVFYILMFVITISRKYAQRFDEATRLSAELERTRDGLEQTVRLRTHDLEVSYEQLKAQKEESENFLSAVLHNIKTPLFALMGYCDMLAEAEAPAQKRSYLNTVHESINYIRDMVDNLSTAFRLERDPGLMRLQPMDLHTTLRSVEATTVGRTCFTETQVGFSITPGALPVRGDDFYLRQALQNIIDNGLRHCGENGVLEVACTATDGTVRVRIADNGDGIRPEDLEHIFERYYTKHPGSRTMGLGLPIAQEIVSAHGGTIEVQSEPGVGSAFTVVLPLATTREDCHG